MIYSLYPFAYDFVFGEKIVRNHIITDLNNETDYHILVPNILLWLEKEVVYPQNNTLIFAYSVFGLYKIDNSYKVFHRDAPISWFIGSKIGRCGEDAKYFVEIMRKQGYYSRQIRTEGWDHSWAEFYTKDNISILVDPSAHRVITESPKEFASRANWTTIWAIEENGAKTNVSTQYI